MYIRWCCLLACNYLAKFESKHSSSIDSIDASPNLEHHRRSKSILKNKSDVSRVLADPESERLLADNMSGSGVSDNGTVMVRMTKKSLNVTLLNVQVTFSIL